MPIQQEPHTKAPFTTVRPLKIFSGTARIEEFITFAEQNHLPLAELYLPPKLMAYPQYPNGKLKPDFRFSIQFPVESNYSWFQSFSNQFRSPDAAIVSDYEDDKPTEYAFSSPHLLGLSPEDTLCRAKKLLALVSGTLFVLGYQFMSRPLTLTEDWYWDADRRERIHTGNAVGYALEFPEEIADFSYQAWSENHPLSIEGKLLFLCHFDTVTFSILTILGHLGISYSSLYSVLDCLKGAGGLTDDAIAEYGRASKADLKRFTMTANHFGVLGVHARHGNLDWKLPQQPPLPLEESQRLILGAAKRFLLQRVDELFKPAWAAANGPQFK